MHQLIPIAQMIRMHCRHILGYRLVSVLGVVVNKDDHILLVRHAYGNSAEWGLPGGSVRMHESPAKAVVREIREETGIETQPQVLISFCASERWSGSFALTFHCTPDNRKLIPSIQASEIASAEWFPLDNMPAPMSKFSKLRTEEYRQGKRGHISIIPKDPRPARSE